MKTIDVGSLLDDAQWSAYQKLLVAGTAMTIILDGLDNQLLGAAVPALMRANGCSVEGSMTSRVLAPGQGGTHRPSI